MTHVEQDSGSTTQIYVQENAMQGPACGSSGFPFRLLCLESSDASESKPSSPVDGAAQ